MQMAMKDGSDDLLSRTKLLSLELLQVFYYQQFADINIMSMVSCLCISNSLFTNKCPGNVQGCLESVNQAFTNNFPFIDLVKAYLCYALLRSCVSPSAAVFQVCVLALYLLLYKVLPCKRHVNMMESVVYSLIFC